MHAMSLSWSNSRARRDSTWALPTCGTCATGRRTRLGFGSLPDMRQMEYKCRWVSEGLCVCDQYRKYQNITWEIDLIASQAQDIMWNRIRAQCPSQPIHHAVSRGKESLDADHEIVPSPPLTTCVVGDSSATHICHAADDWQL